MSTYLPGTIGPCRHLRCTSKSQYRNSGCHCHYILHLHLHLQAAFSALEQSAPDQPQPKVVIAHPPIFGTHPLSTQSATDHRPSNCPPTVHRPPYRPVRPSHTIRSLARHITTSPRFAEHRSCCISVQYSTVSIVANTRNPSSATRVS